MTLALQTTDRNIIPQTRSPLLKLSHAAHQLKGMEGRLRSKKKPSLMADPQRRGQPPFDASICQGIWQRVH